jgi:hypothetical protein
VSADDRPPVEVSIVPHTHWDRECSRVLRRNGHRAETCTDLHFYCSAVLVIPRKFRTSRGLTAD